LSTTQVMLRDCGFATHALSADSRSAIAFEDESTVGFTIEFDAPAELLREWKAVETTLLTRYARAFRSAGDKAWNVYSVLLCPAPADETTARQIRWIEEDLDRTRKIASCGISTREQLSQTLLPLLRIQYQPVLASTDVRTRLLSRLRSIAPRATDV